MKRNAKLKKILAPQKACQRLAFSPWTEAVITLMQVLQVHSASQLWLCIKNTSETCKHTVSTSI